MTRFETAVGGGQYTLSFGTDNHEHYEYMQRAARFCVDGHFFGAGLNYQQLQEELTKAKVESERLEKEVKMYASVNDSLIEDQEIFKKKLHDNEALRKATAKTLQDEIDRLTAELAEERKQHSDVAASWSDDQCKCNRLQVENEGLKKKLNQADEFWKDIICELQTEVNQLKAENAQLRKKGAAYVDDNESLRAKLKHTEMCWKDDIKGLKAERDRLQAEVKRDERIYSTIMSILEREGYDTMSLFFETGFAVAKQELEEKNDRR